MREDLEKIVESVSYIMSRRPINEMNILYVGNLDYYIEIYDTNTETDKEFVALHKRDIWNFLNDGYIAAGLGNFMGCYNEKSVKKNTALLKVARATDGHLPIAMSIYTKFPFGTKCVGLTVKVSDDEKIKELSKEALKSIIKDDISHEKDFVWIECEGAIKHWWEKFGGTKLPNVYLPCIFREQILSDIELIDNEEYDYIRYLGSERIKSRKCIFGFPKKEILEDWIEKRNRLLDKISDDIKKENDILDESIDNESSINYHIELLVQYFLMNHLESWVFSMTEYEYEVMMTSYKILKNHFAKYLDFLDNKTRFRIESILENVETIDECCTFIKPYSLDDYLEGPIRENKSEDSNKLRYD